MKKGSIVGVYSLVHCIVDMACAILISGFLTPILVNNNSLAIGVILYNFFAFAFQVPVGIIADKINKNALVSVVGCLLIIIAFSLKSFGIIACIVAGIGNSFFHIGGGIDVLNISNKKATLPGIYVATGALGLYIGSNSVYLRIDNYYIVLFLILSILLLIWLYKRVVDIDNEIGDIPSLEDIPDNKKSIMYLLLITICIRGYLGLILNFEWKSSFIIGLICVISVVLGKMLGGVIGDKFGYQKISIISLFISAILFIFAFDYMICGILAMLLFNMTMPITLILLSNTFNKNKGFAFGLTTLSLFIGAVPVLLGYGNILFNKISLFILCILSLIVIYYGIKKYKLLENNND